MVWRDRLAAILINASECSTPRAGAAPTHRDIAQLSSSERTASRGAGREPPCAPGTSSDHGLGSRSVHQAYPDGARRALHSSAWKHPTRPVRPELQQLRRVKRTPEVGQARAVSSRLRPAARSRTLTSASKASSRTCAARTAPPQSSRGGGLAQPVRGSQDAEAAPRGTTGRFRSGEQVHADRRRRGCMSASTTAA